MRGSKMFVRGVFRFGTLCGVFAMLLLVTGCPVTPTVTPCEADADCADDGLFCNGDEVCVDELCAHSGNPCAEGETCDEDLNDCYVACETDVDCDDEDVCTTETCVDEVCVYADVECDDGDACTDDSCDAVDGCMYEDVVCGAGEECDPATGDCVVTGCTADAECDDGLFCNGAETCVDGECIAGTDPCDEATEVCNDETDACDPLPCDADDECDDGDLCTDDTCVDGACVFADVVCADEDLCTDDACDAETGGCVFTDVVCDEGFECDPETGDCVAIPACEEDAECDDLLYCNGIETCDTETGECVEGDLPCADTVCECQGETQDPICSEGDLAAECSCPDCPAFEFTLNSDNLTGTSGDDTFLAPLIYSDGAGALVQSFQTTDQANGLAGDDTLDASLNGTNATPTLIAGIETIIFHVSDGDTTVTATNFSGVTSINTVNSTNTLTITGLSENAATAIGITNSSRPAGTAIIVPTYVASVTSGTADELDLTFGGGITSGDVDVTTGAAQGFEIFNVTSEGTAANVIDDLDEVTGTTWQTLNITGDQNLQLKDVDDSVDIINASAFAGNLTLGSGSMVAGTDAYTEASVVDYDYITGGTGDDLLIFDQSLDASDAALATESIDGGDGTDVLQASLTGAIATALPIENIEELRLNTGAAASLLLTGVTGVDTIRIEADAGSQLLTLTNFSGVPALDFRGNGVAGAQAYDSLTLTMTGVSGTETLDLTVGNRGIAVGTGLANTVGGAITANGVEILNLTATDGDATFTNFASNTLTTVTLIADADLTLGTVSGSATNNSIISISASGVTENLSATFADCGDGTVITLGDGNDVVALTGSAGTNTSMTGGSGNDTLTGAALADSINGGAGTDTITGAAGADTLTGGTDVDTFVVAAAAHGGDTYTDFDWGGTASNDNFDYGVAALSVDGTVTSFAGATVTALPADTAFPLNAAIFLCAENIAASTTGTAVANAVVELVDGTDVATAVGLANGDSFLLLMTDGTNYFLFHYLTVAVTATTDAADLTLLGLFSGLDAANAAAGDFL